MTRLIAEIGWNHMGDMSLAEQMISEASRSGADYAKFQTWNVNRLKAGPWDTDGRKEIYEQACLSLDDHKLLQDLCVKHKIEFLSSAFSVEDASLLQKIGCEKVKIPSFEIANYDLLSYCGDNFSHIFISTGTATYSEIEKACSILESSNHFTMFHCVSTYPCDPEISNLTRINYLKNLHPDIGYSDHTFGVEVSKVAVSFNISHIEKHFTIDHELPGRDNKFAILPREMKELSNFISIFNQSMIPHGIDYQISESETRSLYRGRFSGALSA